MEQSTETRSIKQMVDNVRKAVNSLELCQVCQRICECEQWLINEVALVWVCIECRPKVPCRLKKPAEARVPHSC